MKVYHVWALCRDVEEIDPRAAWKVIDQSMSASPMLLWGSHRIQQVKNLSAMRLLTITIFSSCRVSAFLRNVNTVLYCACTVSVHSVTPLMHCFLGTCCTCLLPRGWDATNHSEQTFLQGGASYVLISLESNLATPYRNCKRNLNINNIEMFDQLWWGQV